MSDLCTLHKLAYELKLPREWLRDEADAGRMPCLRIEGRYFFNRAAVEQALATRATKNRVGRIDRLGSP